MSPTARLYRVLDWIDVRAMQLPAPSLPYGPQLRGCQAGAFRGRPCLRTAQAVQFCRTGYLGYTVALCLRCARAAAAAGKPVALAPMAVQS